MGCSRRGRKGDFYKIPLQKQVVEIKMDLENFRSMHVMSIPYKFGHCVEICAKQSLIVQHKFRIRAQFYMLLSHFSAVSPVILNYPRTHVRKLGEGNRVCKCLGSPNQGFASYAIIRKEHIFV